MPGSRAFPCNLNSTDEIDATMDEIEKEMGVPHTLIYNAARGAIGGVLGGVRRAQKNSKEGFINALRKNFDVNVIALAQMAQRLLPAMVEAGEGAIMVTGNTGAHRGKAHFASFAPTKAAQRILCESMARQVGKLGVHVSYITIDALIEGFAKDSVTKTAGKSTGPDSMPAHSTADEAFAKPVDIAEEVWHVAHQARSVWTFDHWIRPHVEDW